MIEKYIKIYFWQFVSIILNFGTLFIVTPFLSSRQSLFGIYSIVIALNIFLSYADLGFISAGLKYASESYAKGEGEQETRIIGFVGFVFAIFVGLFCLVMLIFSFNPQWIVSNLKPGDELATARYLLLLLAIFSPTFILQRTLQVLFSVRLEDYHLQRILIVSNLFKIGSTFYFFGGGRYLLVSYFLFTQICNVFAMVAGIWVAKRRLGYDVGLLFRSFRYSRVLYNKTKSLAFSSLLLTVCWILYYQLDPFVIGKMIGVEAIAVYAIGLTLIGYIRALFGIIFSPFIARFNHYIGMNDNEGLKKLFVNVLVITLPITVFPVLCVVLSVKQLVLNWVGASYLASVPIALFLILCYVFNFITSPGGILVMAYEKIKMVNITCIMLPVIYWTGIALTYSHLGLTSFAVFKFISFTITAVTYFVLVCHLLRIKVIQLLKQVIGPAVLPGAVITALMLMVRPYIPVSHNKIDLLYYLMVVGTVCFSGIAVYYFGSEVFRNYVSRVFQGLKGKYFRVR